MSQITNVNRADNAFRYSGGAKPDFSTRPVPVDRSGTTVGEFRPMEMWKNRGAYYNDDGDRVELDNRLRGSEKNKMTAEEIQSAGECTTCKNRKYADRSDDSSVSFQTPTKLNPSTAAAKVAAHENEHVTNERADAAKEGRRVVSQTVTMHYSTCPECGTSYVAGGQTRTVTAAKNDEGENRSGQNQAEDGNNRKNAEIA